MSAFEFTVEQRQVPGKHQHCWVAVDDASGAVIDLPRGGTGAFLGRYPEIATWLSVKGTPVTLDFSRARGDTFDAAIIRASIPGRSTRAAESSSRTSRASWQA